MTVISLKLPDGLAAQLADQARPSQLSQSDLVADLVGCFDSAPSDLSLNPAYLAGFGER